MDRFKRKPNRTALLTVLLALFFVVSAQAQVGSDATITVDSTYSGYDTSVINDEVIEAEGGTSTTWASAENTAEPHWVELEFSEARNIDTATIHWAYNSNQDQYMNSQLVEVQVWDGSEYETVATMAPFSADSSTSVNFTAAATTKLRFYQPAGQGPASYDSVMWLTEVDFHVASPVTVDSSYSGYAPAVINDEEVDAAGGTSTTWASGESSTEPHWVELELPGETYIDSATIHWAYNNNQDQYMTSQGVEVQAWDGSAYQTVATMTPAGPETSTTVSFEPVTTTKLRFYQPAGQGPVSYTTVMWLTEIDLGLVSPLTVDSTYSGYDTAAINDGVVDATGGTSTTWASEESSTEPHWVQIELGERTIIGSVTIHWAYNQDQYMTSQEVQVQLGSHTVATVTPEGPEASTTITWEPIAANRIRIYQPAGQGPASYNTVMWLTEIDLGLMQQPEASFTTEPSSGFDAGVAIGFVDTSTDADGIVTEWRWDFGDGNVSRDQHPIHTYTQPGSYEVMQVVADNDRRSSPPNSRVLHVGGTEVKSTYSGYSPSVIDDGVIDAMGGTSTTWASAESDEQHWVELHLGEESTVDFATIHWAYNDYQGQYMTSQQVVVQMWDGSSYQIIATMNPAFPETETTVTFDPVTTTRLRFYQPAGQGPATYDTVMWLTEIDYGLSD